MTINEKCTERYSIFGMWYRCDKKRGHPGAHAWKRIEVRTGDVAR